MAEGVVQYEPVTDRPRRRVRRRRLQFSSPGLMFCALMVFMGLAAVNSQANLLFGVFGLMIGVLIVSFSIGRLVLYRLRVVRNVPDHGIVGQRMTLTYEITNEKRFWPSLSVTLAEVDAADAFVRTPVAYLLHAAPGNTAIVPTELIPKRRGLHVFDRFDLSTSFPFGFVRRTAARRQRETLLVYPAVGQVDPKLLLRFRAAEKSGAQLRPKRGGTDEFFGVKEYRRGENPRWIYWKRSARTGTLVSKEMTLVSPPRVLLVMDTCIAAEKPTVEERARVEQAIAMAGSLATHALEAGLMVGLCAWSDGWISIAPNRGKRHGRELLTALARLTRNRTHEAQRVLDHAGELLKSGTTPVLLTPREVDVGLGAQSRGGLVVLTPATPQGRAGFTFDPHVSFLDAWPLEEDEA